VRESAYGIVYNHATERAATLERWIHRYNWTPLTKVSAASRRSVASLNPEKTS
jgi:hypothetical protein